MDDDDIRVKVIIEVPEPRYAEATVRTSVLARVLGITVPEVCHTFERRKANHSLLGLIQVLSYAVEGTLNEVYHEVIEDWSGHEPRITNTRCAEEDLVPF